jgi:hypothetical protein
MNKRFRDALAIQEGACNPSGIAHSIAEACREIRETPGFSGTAQITSDPAIRLMIHQLAFICGVHELESLDAYGKAVNACRQWSPLKESEA